jgi:integrase
MSEKLIIANDLEWTFNEENNVNALHGVEAIPLFSYIKKINKLPLKKGEIRFSDDIWDFNGLTLSSVARRKRTYKFCDSPDAFKDILKFFVLSQLWNQTLKIQSIQKMFAQLLQFVNYLFDQNIISIEYVTLSSIKKFIFIQKDLQPETIKSFKKAIKLLLIFYSSNYKKLDGKEIYRYLNDYDRSKCIAQRESNKWTDIPSDYFDRLLSCMIRVMNDKSIDIDSRGIAAITILLSQTGLRLSELINCTIDSIHSTSIQNNTRISYYMTYMTSKCMHGDGVAREAYTILTPLGQSAYRALDRLYSETRRRFNSNLLFVPTGVKSVPLHETTMPRMLNKFILDYGHEIECVNMADKYPELRIQPVDILIKRTLSTQKSLSRYKYSDTLSIPRTHQFRVHLCSQLYEQGVSMQYIQRHMNHLSRNMTDSYVRPKKDLSKEQAYAESVLRMAVTGDAKLIGDSKDILMATIKAFIARSKFNIATDLDAIIKGLLRKVPIREKNGGICIKSGPIRDCSKDLLTDEIYCAFGMCPNHYHVFFMVDISYDRYKTLIKSMQYNTDHGFTRAAEKEKNKLQWVIKKSLLPELEELKKEIGLKGPTKIKDQHPQISWFVDNINTVYEEVTQWIM